MACDDCERQKAADELKDLKQQVRYQGIVVLLLFMGGLVVVGTLLKKGVLTYADLWDVTPDG